MHEAAFSLLTSTPPIASFEPETDPYKPHTTYLHDHLPYPGPPAWESSTLPSEPLRRQKDYVYIFDLCSEYSCAFYDELSSLQLYYQIITPIN
jgi:hypothetical protein